jgi:hypothetical protein
MNDMQRCNKKLITHIKNSRRSPKEEGLKVSQESNKTGTGHREVGRVCGGRWVSLGF